MKKTIPTIVMAMLCLIFTTKAQQTTSLTGKVITSPDSRPLTGATIKVENGGGVLSNSEGKFTIQTSLLKGLLIISYTGFKTVKVPFSKDALGPFNIILQEVESTLKEVEVNAGYYTVKDKDRTGSISRVSGETIAQQPVSNPLASLIGRMAGVNIEQQSGINGGGFKVEIRGVNSLRTDGRQPLYLVDGIPYPSDHLTRSDMGIGGLSLYSSPLNYLNPADIESIEVLKDADATAIYGSRGANGVVLIKTKNAKIGKTSVNVDLSAGFSKVGSKFDLLNTSQYLEMRNEAFKNDGLLPGLTDYDVNGTWDKNRYTDWQKVLIGGTAHITNLNTSISGGDESTQFSFRGNYNKSGTVTPGDFSDQKGSGSLNVNHSSSNRKFKVSLSAMYGIDNNQLPLNDLTQYINLPPNAPETYNPDGTLNWALDDAGISTWTNPLAGIYQPYKGKTNTLIASSLLGYEVLPNLFARTSLGYTSIRLKENFISPISSKPPSSYARGGNIINSNAMETWIAEPQINYLKNIGNGKLDVLIGSTFQNNNQSNEQVVGNGFTSDLLINNIASAPNRYAEAGASQYKYISIFGRANYNYAGKYIINLTGRRDGSSRFGPGKQFGNFGALGLAWIFSNESFIKQELPILSFGKFRGSYGITGSDQIPNYGYLEAYTSSDAYVDGSGLYPIRIANPDFSWETNRKLEATLDLGFINDRILVSTSWYRNRSSNQLVGYTLPDITGFASVQYNLPATVQNTGWEFEINTLNIHRGSFIWKSSFNLTIPKNKLLSYPNIKGSTYANTYTVGESLYTPRTYNYLGVDPLTGLYTFEDLDGNGTINSADRQPANKAITSHLYGGFQNSLSYKNFSLDVFIQFVNKTNRYAFPFGAAGFMGNQMVSALNRWQKSGDGTDFQKFSQSYDSGGVDDQYFQFTSSNKFYDASYLRLKNVSLTWKIRTLKIYVQGQNLLTLTRFPGDPEVISATFSLPSMRTITMGLQVNL